MFYILLFLIPVCDISFRKDNEREKIMFMLYVALIPAVLYLFFDCI